MIQDSGERRQFESGAVRDIAEGKGRCDLLPLCTVSKIIDSKVLIYLNGYLRSGDKSLLISTVKEFCNEIDTDIETMLLETSIHYEDGAKKYDERNWEQGIPLHCYIDSAVRHYLKHRRGDTDERHDRAFTWNILGAIWTHENVPVMIDLPFKEIEK